jgi:hypothetical protein
VRRRAVFAQKRSLETEQAQGEAASCAGGWRLLMVVGLNLLILGELTWSMYASHGAGEDIASVFLKTFLPMALGTMVLGRLLLRRFFPG